MLMEENMSLKEKKKLEKKEAVKNPRELQRKK